MLCAAQRVNLRTVIICNFAQQYLRPLIKNNDHRVESGKTLKSKSSKTFTAEISAYSIHTVYI